MQKLSAEKYKLQEREKMIAIYGAGAMGTVLGAFVARGGVDVHLISRNEKHIAALKEKGAQICGSENFTQPVTALLPCEMKDKYEIIFLMTKQAKNEEIVAFLSDYLTDDGVIVTTQNGLPESSVARIIGADRTYGCAIAWGATFHGEGVSELTSSPDALTFSLGAYGENRDKLEKIASILSLMGKVKIEDDVMSARWAKLMMNAAFSGLSTATGLTFGQVAKRHSTRKIAQAIIKECIDVAHLCGVEVGEIQGHDVAKLLYYKNPFKKLISYMLIPVAMSHHKNLVSSMLKDLENKRRCEIDYICGAVAKSAREAGGEAPFCERVCEVVHGIEDGAYDITPINAQLFSDLF